ncbi:MAG: GntP family permease [Candidatus Neomarinimicrobiota bacterium]
MVEGPILIFIFIAAVVFIIISTSIIKLHPFLSLLLASFGIGIAVRMPLDLIVKTINQGFGQIMIYIGLVIVLGTIIGTVLDKSGGALKIADVILKLFGKKRPAFAMSIIGAIVSIPVFCDSGFVILSSLNKAVSKRSNISLATLTIALSSGLYATHTLVPPTPGPIAAAGNIGASDFLGTIIWIGLLTSIPAIFVGYKWAKYIGKKIQINEDKRQADISDMLKDVTNLPSTFKSFGPIVLPIVLIAIASTVKLLEVSGKMAELMIFIGSPLVALLLGTAWAFTLFPKFDEKHIRGWIGKGISLSGPILLITGAGGAFGSILKATPMADLFESITSASNSSGIIIIIIAFVVAAALKISQGSSTAALVITSSMLAPFLISSNLESPIALALIVMAIGGGAMTVSHANDSYFWVVTQFSGLNVSDSYRSFTMVTLFQGITVLVTTILLYQILL